MRLRRRGTLAKAQCKLLIVGFDAMDAGILFAGPTRGYWPALERVWMEGNSGPCMAEIAATGPSWTTIYTGQPASVHGVRDAWAQDKDGTNAFYQVVLPFFWDWMNARGLTTGVVNMPITYPPRELDGYMISGFPSPNGACITYPADLPLPEGYVVDYLNTIPGGERVPGVWSTHRNPAEAFTEMERLAWRRVDLLKSLRLCDVMAVQFSVIDHIGHHVDGTPSAISWLYMAYDLCDKLLGAARDIIDAETVVMVSDHGFNHQGHTHCGVFAAAGKGLAPGGCVYRNLDVLPMILEIVGIHPEDLPGESKLVWSKRRPRRRRVVPSVRMPEVDGYTDKERWQVEAQLEALGYL